MLRGINVKVLPVGSDTPWEQIEAQHIPIWAETQAQAADVADALCKGMLATNPQLQIVRWEHAHLYQGHYIHRSMLV